MYKTVIITTFAKDHIDVYGKKFVNLLNQFTDIPIIIYAEDFTKQELVGNYKHIDFHLTIPEHNNFKKHIFDLLSKDKKENNRLQKALRWSYKSFVTIHSLENTDADYIVWLDGDVQAKKFIENDFFKNINKNKLLTAYSQVLYDMIHIESGLVIFNKKHNMVKNVISHYKTGYLQKEILSLKKPWDGFWLGKFVTQPSFDKECNLLRPPFGNVRTHLYHNVGKSKFINTELNKYSGRKN